MTTRTFAKPGTKEAIILRMVSRKQGATGTEVAQAIGWKAIALRHHVNALAYKMDCEYQWFPREGSTRQIAYKLLPNLKAA